MRRFNSALLKRGTAAIIELAGWPAARAGSSRVAFVCGTGPMRR